MSNIKEVVLLFLKLGFVSFGGPAAHNAIMEQEVVVRKKWMPRENFLDFIGATNLIPGPNSTELAMYCGFWRAGWAGLILAGICFICPAVLITGVFAWIYVRFGTIPAVEPFLIGIRSSVLAIIFTAIYRFGKTALKGWELACIGLIVIIASLSGINEISAILSGGVIGMLWLFIRREKREAMNNFSPIAGLLSRKLTAHVHSTSIIAPILLLIDNPSLTSIFFVFLKVGAVLFGSGYVLVAYLDGELVSRLGWITRQQLLDAIAIGQFTPGPLLSTATFVGYQILGIGGAIAATLGIFLPSFVFVALSNPFIPKLRKSKLTSYFLDSVNISAVGIMAAIALKLGITELINWKSIIIFLISASAIFVWKNINSVYFILFGSLVGYILNSLI